MSDGKWHAIEFRTLPATDPTLCPHVHVSLACSQGSHTGLFLFPCKHSQPYTQNFILAPFPIALPQALGDFLSFLYII